MQARQPSCCLLAMRIQPDSEIFPEVGQVLASHTLLFSAHPSGLHSPATLLALLCVVCALLMLLCVCGKNKKKKLSECTSLVSHSHFAFASTITHTLFSLQIERESDAHEARQSVDTYPSDDTQRSLAFLIGTRKTSASHTHNAKHAARQPAQSHTSSAQSPHVTG